jgi:hypothetical protein
MAGAKRCRDGCLRDLAATGAGPRVTLKFEGVGRQFGQLHDVMPRRLRIVRPGLRRQRVPTMRTAFGKVGHDLADPFGRQQQLLVRRMARLPARRLAAGLFRRPFGQRGLLPRRRGRLGQGVQLARQRLDQRLQLRDTRFQRGDACIPLPTPWTLRYIHANMLAKRSKTSCARFTYLRGERLHLG